MTKSNKGLVGLISGVNMKVERMEVLGVNVKNLDEAIEFFSDLLAGC